MLEGKVVLGGKQFGIVDFDRSTVLHAHYIESLMRSTGLDRVLPREDEPELEYMLRLNAALVDTLKLPALLAGWLIELPGVETDWTLERAAVTQKFIEQLTNPRDKAEVHKLGQEVTFTFFRDGIASLNHSQNVFAKLIPPSQSPSRSQNAAS